MAVVSFDLSRVTAARCTAPTAPALAETHECADRYPSDTADSGGCPPTVSHFPTPSLCGNIQQACGVCDAFDICRRYREGYGMRDKRTPADSAYGRP